MVSFSHKAMAFLVGSNKRRPIEMVTTNTSASSFLPILITIIIIHPVLGGWHRAVVGGRAVEAHISPTIKRNLSVVSAY